jgi:CO/xanthine dehydrogenase FAD-binding subunit
MSALEDDAELARSPWAALADGAASVGGPLIRHRATVGGNLRGPDLGELYLPKNIKRSIDFRWTPIFEEGFCEDPGMLRHASGSATDFSRRRYSGYIRSRIRKA